jgi:hypothetical protein
MKPSNARHSLARRSTAHHRSNIGSAPGDIITQPDKKICYNSEKNVYNVSPLLSLQP